MPRNEATNKAPAMANLLARGLMLIQPIATRNRELSTRASCPCVRVTIAIVYRTSGQAMLDFVASLWNKPGVERGKGRRQKAEGRRQKAEFLLGGKAEGRRQATDN
jgi:hypothetical protein